MVSTPKPPDPAKTAAAQTASNIDTANASQLVNQVNQVTPDGSLKYDQTGMNSYTDANGKTYQIPQYTATQTLSPENQKIYQTNLGTKQTIANIGNSEASKIQDVLSTPFQLGNEQTEARLYDLGSKRLDPQFAASEDALRTRLANSGIQPGSQAYDRQMAVFSQGKNDAYNQLLLNGRSLADQELTTERNQPINEISALLSGSQIGQPNYVSTPNTQVAGTDVAGIYNDAYKTQAAQSSAALGGLFGLAGNGLMAWFG